MDLGAYTFALLPGQMTVIKAVKDNASVQTYTDVAYFSWTSSIVGKTIMLNWNAMTSAQFNSTETIYQADAEVVFDATEIDGVTDTYNVEVVNFTGDYLQGIDANRINCNLELLIMSVV